MAYNPSTPVIYPFTPDQLEGTFPCVECLSGEKERWIAIVYILWRILNGSAATFTVDNIESDCACFKCVRADQQLMDYLIATLAAYAVAIDAIPDLPVVADAACLQCEDTLTLKQQALCLFGHWINSLRSPS